jgi:hypothetical protein
LTGPVALVNVCDSGHLGARLQGRSSSRQKPFFPREPVSLEES